MDFENEIFKRTIIHFNKLENYGFKKQNKNYKYSKIFMDTFKTDIIVNNKGLLSGKIYDLNTGDEYFSFRIKGQDGKFVNEIRNEYRKILEDIKSSCTEELYFITEQANRITNKIKDKYKDNPEFLWKKFPGYGVFRNSNTNKWYGIIVNINKRKLDNEDKEVEIINVKLEEEKIKQLLNKQGFYPAYHMNKKSWISIVLDDTINDDEIMDYINESYQFTG